MDESKIVVTMDGAHLIELVRIITDRDERAALEFLKRIFQPEIDKLGRG